MYVPYKWNDFSELECGKFLIYKIEFKTVSVLNSLNIMVADNRYMYQHKFVEDDNNKTYRNMYTIINIILISLIIGSFIMLVNYKVYYDLNEIKNRIEISEINIKKLNETVNNYTKLHMF